MSTIRRKRPTPQQESSMRKIIIYGEIPGTGGIVDETEDGAIVKLSTPDHLVELELNAENLMMFTRSLAGWFGHTVVHPHEWRDKLRKVIEDVCEKHEARCLDDDIDRGVVVNELLKALVTEIP